MSQPEPKKPAIAHCPEHRTRMRAMVRPEFYRCKKCKTIWWVPAAAEVGRVGKTSLGGVE